MNYLLFKWELGECLYLQQVRKTMSLTEFMKPFPRFYYVRGLVLFLAICGTIQCFEGLGTANKMDGRVLSPVLSWCVPPCSEVHSSVRRDTSTVKGHDVRFLVQIQHLQDPVSLRSSHQAQWRPCHPES